MPYGSRRRPANPSNWMIYRSRVARQILEMVVGVLESPKVHTWGCVLLLTVTCSAFAQDSSRKFSEAYAAYQSFVSVNNPSEALGFYESGDVLPLVAFTNKRLPMFKNVPTLKESGGDFAYFMQRAVVGAPGMSDAALAFYTDLFTKTYKSAAWQKYKTKKIT